MERGKGKRKMEGNDLMKQARAACTKIGTCIL